MSQAQKLALIKRLADELIATAIANGVVVTIEQHSVAPFAMGRYVTESRVREVVQK